MRDVRQGIVGLGLWLLATALVALLTHLTAILILPRVATRDAFHRLAHLASDDHLSVLPRAGPDERLIPFGDPNTVQGLCVFDLANAPVRVRTKVDEGHLLTLSFRTQEGQIFYAMTDRAALRGAIDIRLVTDAQLEAVEAGDDENQGLTSELRLKAPAQRGMIVATALVAHPGDRQEAENLVKAITCRPEPIATAAR